MAKQDCEAALHDFADADASDLAKVRELQMQIRVARKFEQYLAELITRGREAFETYKQQKEES